MSFDKAEILVLIEILDGYIADENAAMDVPDFVKQMKLHTAISVAEQLKEKYERLTSDPKPRNRRASESSSSSPG